MEKPRRRSPSFFLCVSSWSCWSCCVYNRYRIKHNPVPLLFSVWYLTHFLASGAQRKQWSSSYRGDSAPTWQAMLSPGNSAALQSALGGSWTCFPEAFHPGDVPIGGHLVGVPKEALKDSPRVTSR